MTRLTKWGDTRTFEQIDAVIDGRAVLIEADCELAGEIGSGCRQTHDSPAEPPSVDFGVVSVAIRAVSDAETLEDLALTPEVIASAVGSVRSYVEGHTDQIARDILADEREAAEAAMWDAVDRAINERRERGLCR